MMNRNFLKTAAVLLLGCTAATPSILFHALPAAAQENATYDAGNRSYLAELQDFYVYPGSDNTAILESAKTSVSGHVIIPETFEYTQITGSQTSAVTMKITYINRYAFHNCTSVERITLSSSVNRIGDGAFSGCKNLTALVLPDNGSSIDFGKDVFSGDSNIRIYGNYETAPDWLGEYRALYAGPLAEEGVWKQDSNGRWWFQWHDGTWPKNQWAQISGFWYHFDEHGFRQTGWIKLKQHWYYLYANGKMASSAWIGSNYVNASGIFIANSWKQTDGKWWYRLGDGTYPRKTWCTIDGKKYLFDEDGYMLTGWVRIENKWYHLSRNGALDTDTTIDGYYVNADGVWVEDRWEKIDGKWRYRYADGTLAGPGMVKIGKQTYCFDASGYMQTGWIQSQGNWRYFRSSGEMAADAWIGGYYVDASGIWQK